MAVYRMTVIVWPRDAETVLPSFSRGARSAVSDLEALLARDARRARADEHAALRAALHRHAGVAVERRLLQRRVQAPAEGRESLTLFYLIFERKSGLEKGRDTSLLYLCFKSAGSVSSMRLTRYSS